MKIRAKLLITFLSAIILPIILTLTLFSVYFSYKTRDEKFNRNDINKSATELSLKISYFYPNIDNYNTFNQNVKTELKNYSSLIEYIEITDLSGNITYNSKDINMVGTNIDFNKLLPHFNDIYNFSFNEKDSNYYLKVIKPLIINGSTKGFILFKQNPYMIIEYTKTIAYPILWFGTASIILVIIFFSWLISRGIIIPLKELSNATELIAKGNLDFEIKYKRGDELGTLCSAFETMRDKLKESLSKQIEYENSRKELVASISHDLRTPLTSIKGYVEGLRDGIIKDPYKFQKYLEVIYNKTESMNKLIDDLFEYSQLDLNSIKMNKQKIESKEMLKEIANNIKYDIEKEGFIFRTSINLQPFLIDADKLRIEEVINNLISNAIRYTKTSIDLNAIIVDDNLLVSIKDDGCGIKSDDRQKIFDRFYRGEKSRTAIAGGAGLGLAIAKKIIEKHSGKIWVESEEGHGSTFTFTIPKVKTNP